MVTAACKIFALAAFAAIVLGFVAIPPAQALALMTAGGYWAILGTFSWFVWSLWRLVRADGWRPARPAAGDWKIIALIAGCGLLLLVHERYGFKILMDEIMLLDTSMGMHFDKHPLYAIRGHDLQGAFQLLDGRLDKRPLFQPFLVSTLHDLTGYRPENVFVLNTALTFGLLALVYRLGRRLVSREAGVLAVLLLTSLPLLAQNATGGGFELLNLFMILLTYLLALRFAEKRDAPSQQALLLSAVLLAQTRYESVLFLIPVGLLVLWAWWREQRPILDWGAVFVPLLLVPAALHQKIFSVQESSWELASQPGFAHPFAFSYAQDNFLHWLIFFFDTTGSHSNSLVLSGLGWLALPFALLASAKILARFRTATPLALTAALFNLGFAAHSLLMLVYFWGRFDDPVIRRLSLPLNLWLVLAVVLATAELFRRPWWIWRALMGVVGIGFFAYSLPSMSRHDYSLDYYVGREMEWRRDFIAAHPEKDYLFIDNNALIWITHLVSGTPVGQALTHKDIIIFNFQNHTFGAFYVFQRFDVDPSTGRLIVQKDDDLGPDFELKTYWERRFTPLTVSRISRVVSIKPGPTSPPPRVASPLEKMSPAQRDKVRQEYFEQMVKRLP
ncbi:MAG: glycosyltransferase family 39 protein [Lacunisphaera sp.]